MAENSMLEKDVTSARRSWNICFIFRV